MTLELMAQRNEEAERWNEPWQTAPAQRRITAAMAIAHSALMVAATGSAAWRMEHAAILSEM